MGCASPVEDEVFEEEEPAEVEGGSARLCHPACSRGRRIQARRAGPRRRPHGDILHAAGYDMQVEALPHEMLMLMMKMRLIGGSWEPPGGLLEASWGLLGPLGGSWGTSWGPKLAQVADKLPS